MARKARSSSLDTRTSRLKLTVRAKPYNGPQLARGILLLYRRNKTNGTWVLKASNGHGAYWTKGIGEADDFDESNGNTVLTFFQAQDVAKKLARGGSGETDATAPISVDRALTDYRRDLLARDARTYNAEHPRAHLTAVLLSKPVQLLTSRELKAWRDSLLAMLKPASVVRLCNSLRAAFELAALHDPRIKNHEAWRVGLAVLPSAQTARNIVLPDTKVHALVAGCYRHDAALGLFADTLATTGARPIQAARLTVEDLHDHPVKPKLMMPKTAKGGGRNRSQKKTERYSVPISVALSQRLKQAAAGRAPDALLLVQADGASWGKDPSANYRRAMREVLTSIGEDPDKITLYCLRHSNIVRMLLKNIPIRLIASLHNTSVQQIEKNYSAHITEHSSDDLSRTGLLPEPAPVADNVVALVR
jgi:integrase